MLSPSQISHSAVVTKFSVYSMKVTFMVSFLISISYFISFHLKCCIKPKLEKRVDNQNPINLKKQILLQSAIDIPAMQACPPKIYFVSINPHFFSDSCATLQKLNLSLLASQSQRIDLKTKLWFLPDKGSNLLNKL